MRDQVFGKGNEGDIWVGERERVDEMGRYIKGDIIQRRIYRVWGSKEGEGDGSWNWGVDIIGERREIWKGR